MSAMHEIRVTHRFQEIERTGLRGDNFISIEECQDCHAKEEVLHLRTGLGSSWETASQKEIPALSRKLPELLETMNQVCNKQIDSILRGSNCENICVLTKDIEKLYENQISAKEMQFAQLSDWVRTPNKKFKRKVLLASKQGLACNRCDKIFSWAEMTLDEITPKSSGGKAILTNSQLLCRKCNKAKDSQLPDERDISPFVYQGPSCIHEVNCTHMDEPR